MKKNKKMIAFKGTDNNLQCRGFQFEIGKTYMADGESVICKSGFHSCENPLSVFNYYAPGDGNRFFLVEISGQLSIDNNREKIASTEIHFKSEFKLHDFIGATIEYSLKKCSKNEGNHATGDKSASSATGDQRASSATGYQSASSATGDKSASSATGNYSTSSATGYRSASSATGYQSASSATGDRSASSATGYQSASSATGDKSASSATGNRSASSATGDQSASSATGNYSASSVTGKSSVAINIGKLGKAMADEFGAIVLCNHDENGYIRHIKASKVGENGIKPNVWYILNYDGEFVEYE